MTLRERWLLVGGAAIAVYVFVSMLQGTAPGQAKRDTTTPTPVTVSAAATKPTPTVQSPIISWGNEFRANVIQPILDTVKYSRYCAEDGLELTCGQAVEKKIAADKQVLAWLANTTAPDCMKDIVEAFKLTMEDLEEGDQAFYKGWNTRDTQQMQLGINLAREATDGRNVLSLPKLRPLFSYKLQQCK